MRLTDLLTEVPPGEVRHYHDYREYYLILSGRATLVVDGKVIAPEGDQF